MSDDRSPAVRAIDEHLKEAERHHQREMKLGDRAATGRHADVIFALDRVRAAVIAAEREAEEAAQRKINDDAMAWFDAEARRLGLK